MEPSSSYIEELGPFWEKAWTELSIPPKEVRNYWNQLIARYSSAGRAYHNLNHLRSMLRGLNGLPIQKEEAVLILAIFYHDAIYATHRSDNEERSAQLAIQELSTQLILPQQVQRVASLIRMTKTHVPEEPNDRTANILLDLDLGILGSAWPDYETYTRQIRKEYRVYPNILYRKGRRKALEHFLSRPVIYQTPEFFDQYESQARQNLQKEHELLGA